MNRRDFAKAVASLAAGFAVSRRREGTRACVQPLNAADHFNVRDFGALGDGATDDSQAFDRALARAARNGGSVFVPEGTFLVNRMLRVSDGVMIEGIGSRSIIEHVDGDPVAILCSGARAVGVYNVQIRGRFAFGLVIERSTAVVVRKCMISGGTIQWFPTAFCGGIFAMYSNDVRIDGNSLSGNGLIRPGVLSSDIQVNGFGKNTASRSIRITANRCRSISTQCCISAYDTQQSEINENICLGAKTGPNNNNGYGIMIYQTAGSPGSCFENTVGNNQISDTQGSAIYLVQSNHSRVTDNSIASVASVQADHSLPVAGVALNQSEHVIIAHNRIMRVGRAGISIASNRKDVGHVEVTDNTITHTGGMGIHLRGPLTDIRVSRNTVTDTNGGIGSYTSDAQDQIEIVGNTVSASRSSSPGIILSNAGRSTVRNNRVSDSGGYGLALTLRDDESDVADNIVVRSGRAFGGKSQDIRVSREKEPATSRD